MPRAVRLQYFAAALIAPLAIAACSQTASPPASGTTQEQSEEGYGLSRPAGLGEEGEDLTIPPANVSSPPAEGGDVTSPEIEEEVVIIEEPEVVEELEEGEAIRRYEEARREATASCYRYAHAQTLHDQQIIDDQSAAFDDSTFDPNLSRIQSQAEEFGLKRRERRLMESCLRAKGF